MADANTIDGLVDHVCLQLLSVPDDERVEAVVHLLHDYNMALAERFPGREAERKRFLTAFYVLLLQRWNALAATADGTVGTA